MSDEKWVVKDGFFDKLDLVGMGANEETFSVRKSVKDNTKTEKAKHSVHEPDFSGTNEKTGQWSSLDREDFPEDTELSEIDDHFVVSKTGFPPENFGDLSLEVVDEEGNLDPDGLESAHRTVAQVEGLPENDIERARNIIERLARQEFGSDTIDFLEDEEKSMDIKEVLKEQLSEEEFEKVKDKDEDELFDLFKNSLPEGGSGSMADQTEEEVQDSEEEVEKSQEEQDEIEEQEESSSDNESTELTKSDLPEELQEKLEKAEELEEKVEKEREKRLQKEYEEKARTEYEDVSKSAEELGSILKEIDEKLSEETAEDVKSLLKAQAEQIKKGEAFAEFGSSDKGSAGQGSEFEEQAKEVLENRDDVDTIEKARVEVARENPELIQ